MSAARDVVSTVFCDGASDGCYTDDMDAMAIPEHRRWLRKEGWTAVMIDGRLHDFCPPCSKVLEVNR